MGRFSTVGDLVHKITSDAPGTSKLIQEGRRAALAGEGTHSIFAWPFTALARRLKGKQAVTDALYEGYHRPLKNIDEKAGKLLAKVPGGEKLFRQVDVLPTSRKMGGNRTLIEHETHSVTAPVTKAVGMVTPIAAALWAADKLGGKDEQDKMASPHDPSEKDELLKQAGDALEMAHKRTEAEKLAFQMVENGKIAPFQKYEEFQEKVASILEKDLAVVKEALEMDSSMANFGKVAEADAASNGDATSKFYHSLASD